MKETKKLGVIVSVQGDIAQVGMYNMSNDAELVWYGDILTGPKIGAFLTINQNNVKIISTVSTEKIIDQQNTVKSVEFDNLYNKHSINRIISLKTKGVIENGKFQVTSRYVPMIGNELTLTTIEELNIIYGIENNNPSIHIGKSILEGQPISIPIDKFFASHIGIFGNTGSGKSNTLHKIYLQLLNTMYRDKILERSQIFVIDFNGEYTGDQHFGISVEDDKSIFKINTRNSNEENKLPVKKKYLFDADVLSILFDARPATQVPFLRRAINLWNEQNFDGNKISKFVVGTVKKVLTSGDAANSDAKDNWISVAKTYISNNDLFDKLESLTYHTQQKAYFYQGNTGEREYINDKSEMSFSAINYLKLPKILQELTKSFDSIDQINKLKFHLEFQKVHQSAWKSTNIEHINPLFNRIDTAFNSLQRVIEVVDDITNEYKAINIISLVHANQEITRLLPMLISKMIYDEQKNTVSEGSVNQTKHLIIDEAHNILNAENRNSGDDWQDYRLSVFEEIIKEGRKFGFYLTLSSQRPADISSTILSQVHNYFIHRLVNDKDLKMLENTMPTLDRNSIQMIPSLGQGEAIITGNAIKIPVFVKVKKEELNRPDSDDVILTELWSAEKE